MTVKTVGADGLLLVKKYMQCDLKTQWAQHSGDLSNLVQIS